jgi:plexin A
MTHGANYCPRFRRPADDILLPNNVPKEIVLEVENLPHPQVGHTGFQCIVNIEGAKMMVPARVDNPFIVCDKTTVSVVSILTLIFLFSSCKFSLFLTQYKFK